MKSFLKGILSIFNIFPTLDKKSLDDDYNVDYKALKSDWEQVGKYFPIK